MRLGNPALSEIPADGVSGESAQVGAIPINHPEIGAIPVQ
jgi:hypothetical protein